MTQLKALIYGLRISAISFEKGCFVNGIFDLELSDVMPKNHTVIITPSVQSAHSFQGHNYTTFPCFQENETYDACFVLLPKQRDQALHDVAMALKHLRPAGNLILCAQNDAGGKRIPDILSAFGLSPAKTLSKFHCKFALAKKSAIVRSDVVDFCIEQGGFQKNSHDYYVKPGVFGWKKIDQGSEVLAETFPDDLSGRGADFGCGYGYLTDQVLLKNPKVEHMTCFDSDYFAIQSCEENIKNRHSGRSFECVWADMTRNHQNLDNSFSFIVMNPPFHEGKDQDISLGKDMIGVAHQALGQYGELYMVANNHLPYEGLLEDLFFQVETVVQKKGFKVFKALK